MWSHLFLRSASLGRVFFRSCSPITRFKYSLRDFLLIFFLQFNLSAFVFFPHGTLPEFQSTQPPLCSIVFPVLTPRLESFETEINTSLETLKSFDLLPIQFSFFSSGFFVRNAFWTEHQDATLFEPFPFPPLLNAFAVFWPPNTPETDSFAVRPNPPRILVLCLPDPPYSTLRYPRDAVVPIRSPFFWGPLHDPFAV